MMARALISLVVITLTALYLAAPAAASDKVPQGKKPPNAADFVYKGFSFPSWRNGTYASPEAAASLDEAASLHANWVAIIPTRYVANVGSAEFRATEDTESDTNVLRAIAAAHARGLKVLLKPHVDSLDGKWRGEFKPSNVGHWFRNYRTMLVHYADLAAASGADMFSIGCEYDKLTGPAYRARWLEIIASVRRSYAGPITYAGDWIAAKDVSFWDQVDFIGIDAYNPLASHPDPSVEELVAGWTTVSRNRWAAGNAENQSPVDFYHRLSTTYRKPVIFTEIGYKSTAGAATMPGDWQRRGPVSLQEQANAYQAFFKVWGKQASWMHGAFFWNWEPHPTRDGEPPTGWGDYTPQGKPAALVLRRGFGHTDDAGLLETR